MTSLHFSYIFAADCVHLSAYALLSGWILHKRTCKGVSGRTQAISALVNWLQFAYTAFGNSIFREAPEGYMEIISGFQAAESCVVLYLIYVKYKKTVEKSYDTFWIELIIILAVSFSLTYNSNRDDPLAVLYYCSRYLDSGSFVPQIYFNFRTGSKALPVSLFVLLTTLSTCFYVYYCLTDKQHYLTAIDVDRISDYVLIPAFIKMGFSMLFWVMLVVVPKHKEVVPFSEVDSTSGVSMDSSREGEPPPPIIVVTRPQLARQQSRLETPFLKKSLPSTNSLTSTIVESSRKNSPYPTKKSMQLSLSKFYNATNTPLKRSPLSTKSFSSFGMSSETSTPEYEGKDEGFMFVTAQQSRKRRMAYRRQSSLPDTRTENLSVNEIKKEDARDDLQVKQNKVTFEIGGSEEDKKRSNSLSSGVFSSHNSLDGWSKKEPQDTTPESIPVHLPASREKTGAESENQEGAEEIHVLPESQAEQHFKKSEIPSVKIPGKSKAALKVGDTKKVKKTTNAEDGLTKLEKRRASMYVGNPPTQQHNWKMLASNLIGTSPLYERRFSVLDTFGTEKSLSDDERFNKVLQKSKKISTSSVEYDTKRRATVFGSSSPHWKKFPVTNFNGVSPTLSRPTGPTDNSKTGSPIKQHHKRRRTIWHL